MLSVERGRFLIPLLLLLVLPHETQGMDGCEYARSWRCNDVCIDYRKNCQCGNETFGFKDLKWCCNNVILHLNESCEGRCNYYPNDINRNHNLTRSFVPLICEGNKTTCVQEGEGGTNDLSYKPTICTGNSSCGGELTWCREEERKEEKCPFRFAHCPGIRSNKKGGNRSKSISGQCVEATKLEDGEVSDCLDRSDEQVFQEGKDSTFKEAAIINLDKLQFCTGESGGWKYLGLDCGEPEEWPFPCMPMFFWCQDFLNLKCPVLGSNSTDIYTNNPTICANTTFWREKNCGKWDGEDLIRCTGNLTGQCVSKSFAKD